MRLEWSELDRCIAALTAEFVARARTDATARRLATIPGLGALNATALVAAIGTGETFRSTRDLAAWLGLVPLQATTGGKPRLLGIPKRGSTYLRTLLIHGVHAALPVLSAKPTAMGEWLRGLIGRAELHLGRGTTPRPDTLAQTGQIPSQKPPADRTGHTF